jgi:DNA polymerase I-like protein with 3'-5' exonuclease and polymerase domains
MKFRGHPVPRDFKKDIETTAKVELERLAKRTKDPLYNKSLQYREFEKMKSTYVDGWKPDDVVEYRMFDTPQVVLAGAEPTSSVVVGIGRVHTTFTFRPATGQLSSRGPNIQNAPKHEGQRAVPGLAGAFRRIVEARPGHRIVTFDYKSFHALTLGFEAGDATYMRMARLDIHSFLTAHMLKLEGCDNLLARSDDELREYFRWLKSDKDRLFTRDFKAKRAILGYGFGLGYRKLYDMNQEAFTRQAEAKRTIEMLNRTFPKTAQFRNTIRMRAHRDTFLLSRHGCIRHFFDVYHWDSKYGANRPGRDSEKAIAYLPANDAFGHIKDAMLRLEESGWNERANFFNQIHDDLHFEIPDAVFDEAVPAILAEMTKPSEILIDPVTAPAGLQCAVEVKAGRTWEKMEEVTV